MLQGVRESFGYTGKYYVNIDENKYTFCYAG